MFSLTVTTFLNSYVYFLFYYIKLRLEGGEFNILDGFLTSETNNEQNYCQKSQNKAYQGEIELSSYIQE